MYNNGILEFELKLDDNHFLIRYECDSRFFLIRVLPFLIAEVDSESATRLQNKEINATDILNNYSNYVDIFNRPGVFFQPIMILTNQCNLRCKYCYADEGSYGMNGYNVMKEDTVHAVVDYVCRNLEKHASELDGLSVELPFVAFGGEALINRRALYALIKYSKEKCLELSKKINADVKALTFINTNGILITDELLEYLSPFKDVIEFVVSFDGIYHDENRITINGEGSVDATIAGLRKLNEYGFDYYITCCLIPDKLDQIFENIEYIRSVIGNRRINLSFIRGAVENVKSKVQYPGRLQQQYTNENVHAFTENIVRLINEGVNVYVDKFMRCR